MWERPPLLQRSLGHGYRNGQMNVVARAREDRMRAGADNEKQVAGAPPSPRVTFTLQANPLASRVPALMRTRPPRYG